LPWKTKKQVLLCKLLEAFHSSFAFYSHESSYDNDKRPSIRFPTNQRNMGKWLGTFWDVSVENKA
jgi:hypothetical protein